MDQPTDRDTATAWHKVVTALLWLATAVLSVVIIPATLDVVTRIYGAFWGDGAIPVRAYWGAVFIRQMVTIPLAMLAVAITIGGAEYHLRNVGSDRSWRLFAITLALEIGLLMVALTL
jgi:hypothetical protein